MEKEEKIGLMDINEGKRRSYKEKVRKRNIKKDGSKRKPDGKAYEK